MATKRFFICTLVWTAILAGFCGVAWAQDTSTGSISGTVTDASGATVKGALVAIRNVDRGETIRTVATSSTGYYTATYLPLGTYTVKITASGFESSEVTGI